MTSILASLTFEAFEMGLSWILPCHNLRTVPVILHIIYLIFFIFANVVDRALYCSVDYSVLRCDEVAGGAFVYASRSMDTSALPDALYSFHFMFHPVKFIKDQILEGVIAFSLLISFLLLFHHVFVSRVLWRVPHSSLIFGDLYLLFRREHMRWYLIFLLVTSALLPWKIELIFLDFISSCFHP